MKLLIEMNPDHQKWYFGKCPYGDDILLKLREYQGIGEISAIRILLENILSLQIGTKAQTVLHNQSFT